MNTATLGRGTIVPRPVPSQEGVQCYASEINRRMRPHLRMSGASYRTDETYVKVGAEWKYLYRAVNSSGQTIEFMLSARRNVSAAKRIFQKNKRSYLTQPLSPSPGPYSHFSLILLY